MKKTVLGLCGPSGSGKEYIFNKLIEDGFPLERIVSYTTRPITPNEINGVNYYFTTHEDFKRREKNGEFFESGCWGDRCYGTPKSEFERIIKGDKIPVLEIGHIGMCKMQNILASNGLVLHPVGILPGELTYDQIIQRHPDMEISFDINTGIPLVPAERDQKILNLEYQSLLRKRLVHRSRESAEDIEKRVLASSEIIEFFLSGKAQEFGFKMISNTLGSDLTPIKELLLRAKFLNENRNSIKPEFKFKIY